MRVKYILIIIGFFLSVYAQAQKKSDKKTTRKEAKKVLSIPERFYSDQDKKIQYEQLVDDLQQRIIQDSRMKLKIQDIPDSNIRIIESDDRKIRLLTWKQYNTPYYEHLIQYSIAPNKARYFHFGNPYGYKSKSTLGDILSRESIIIDTILHINNGNYLLQGIMNNKEYRLISIDIGRGILKSAYLFHNEINEAPLNDISLSVDTSIYNIRKIKTELIGNKLKIPKADSLNNFTGEYVDCFFNGSYFEDSISYHDRLPGIQDGKELITRLYFKDADNKIMITSTYPKDKVSLELDYVTNHRIEYNPKKPYTLKIKNDKEIEHYQGGFFDIAVPLKPINDRFMIENVCPYYLPIISEEETKDDILHSVTYTAGRESAYPYEWLRYSAVAFNRIIKYEESARIRWALEIDGKIKILKGKKWRGPQIDLQMEEEWLGKTIQIIPYIEGCQMDKSVAIETTIEPYPFPSKNTIY